MALPEFSLRQLLEAGVHFGHQTHRWNPRMDPYIYGSRNGIHILDLTQTVPMLEQALKVVRETVAKNGRVLFVGTKRQASKHIADAAERSAQYYMNHRWLGGTLTNWKTVSNSISRLKTISEQMEKGFDGLTKKERLGMEREHAKLHASLAGIVEMGGTPDLLFVVDTNKESLAVAEANKLGIPVIGILDSNSAPEGIDYPIPGNDDAGRAISLYCDLIARAALDGMVAQMGSQGIDIGALDETLEEEIPASPHTSETTQSNAKADDKADDKENVISDDIGTKPAVLDQAPEQKDDLKKISGVGPKLEEKLNAMGIYHFSQIALWSFDEIQWVNNALSLKGRIERDDWIEQVTTLMNE